MTIAAAPRGAMRPPNAQASEARRHLDLMGYGPGAVELVAGSNAPSNPDKIELLTYAPQAGRPWTTRAWVEAERLGDLERRAARLGESWGNVYISVGTYGKGPDKYRPGRLSYTRAAPLARRCIVADDVTNLAALPLPPTWATRTSAGNHQVGYVCDELLRPAEAVRLAEGLALLLGADPSGSDAQQLIRLAGSLNTKAKCDGRPGNPAQGIEPEGYRVRLVAEGPRYSAERLARALLPGGLAELRRGAAEGRTAGEASQVESMDPAAVAALLDGLPDGAALMASGRYRYLFTHRPQLAALALGQRVTLPTRYGLRDSGSEQVAVLVSNLASTGRRNDAGAFVPGLGAPPLDEIRAVALYWRDTLRPGCDLGRYVSDVERLLRPAPDGYLPAGYAPEATKGATAPASAPALPRLAEAQHKGPGRPAGQRADKAEQLAALLAERVGEIVTRGTLAEALGLRVRMVAYLLGDLVADGRAELKRAGRGLRVVRCAINTPPADVQSVEAEGAAEGIRTPSADVQSSGSTHPPYCPGGAGVPGAAAGAAELWGDADRLALAGEWVALGYPGRAWFVALDLADGERRAALLDGLRPLVQAEAAALDERARAAFVGELVAEALGQTPATPPPTSEQVYPLAELLREGLDTLGEILDPDTGELRRVRVDADLLRAWVAERAPGLDTSAIEDLLPQVRADRRRRREAARIGAECDAYRAKLRTLGDLALLKQCKSDAGRHAAAKKRSDPRAGYLGAMAAVSDSERRRRGLDLAALDAEAQGEKPRKTRRQSFSERRAAQHGQAERRAGMLALFDARAHDAVTAVPEAPPYLDPPADDVPHPVEVETPCKDGNPMHTPAPSAAPPPPLSPAERRLIARHQQQAGKLVSCAD